MRYMLDTNMCIYMIKHKPERVFQRLCEHEKSEICISSVTYSELCYGVEKSAQKERNRVALTLFLAGIEVLNYDSDASEVYGAVRAELERAGTPVGGMDMMIAAHAIAEACILVTNNCREFERIPKLSIENWV